MRVKELKPNTEYATGGGSLVVTGDAPVERGWYSYREERGGPVKIARALPGGQRAKTADPWATRTEQRMAGRSGIVGIQEGVRVTRYHTDRHGARTGEGTDAVIDPKEIKGLWSTFLELHGDRVASRHLKEDARAKRARAAQELHARVEAVGLTGVEASASIEFTVVMPSGEKIERQFAPSTGTVIEYRIVPAIKVNGDAVERVLAALEKGGE